MAFWERLRRSKVKSLTNGHRWVDIHSTKPSDLRSFVRRQPLQNAIETVIACCESYNGYTRQAALKTLQEFDCPEALPAVLARLGDWVPQVRAEAERTLHHLLDLGHSDKLVQHHELIEAMPAKGRVDLTPIAEKLKDAMRSPPAIDTLIAGLDDPWVIKRRFCFRTIAGDPENHPLVVERALADPDPSVRRWLANCIIDHEVQASHSVLRVLMHDRSSIVTTTVIRSFDIGQARAELDQLISLATHRCKATRAAAQYWIRTLGTFDLKQHVRGLLDAAAYEEAKPGVIAALGEIGQGEADASRAAEWADSTNTAQRVAAIQSISRLTRDEEFIQTLFTALADTNAKVRYEARHALLTRPRHLWSKQITAIFLEGDDRESFEAGRILLKIADWKTLPVFLAAVEAAVPHRRDLGFIGISSCFEKYGTRGWLKPDARSWDRLLEQWDRIEQRNPPEEHQDGWEQLRALVEKGQREKWYITH